MTTARLRVTALTVLVLALAACRSGESVPKRASGETAAAATAPAERAAPPVVPAQPVTPPPPAPPPGAPTKPAYLQPRTDGTYVDMKGNILTPPPVMLGVTMEQPGKAIVKHMGVNPARTTLLVDVIPGLPAAKAGIEDHDLVIAVDGSNDAGPHDIRRKLRTMKAGDSITFTIRRGSESKTVTLNAVAWQAEHMVRPLHAGSFAKPNLDTAAERDSAPRELQPVMDRLDRIEKQLQQLSGQVPAGSAPAAQPAPAAPPAPPAPAPSTPQ
jgi:membrane-associated protease RseP (regulator of RpoE activity)